MTHAWLITGGDAQKRQNEAEKIAQELLGEKVDWANPNHPDLAIITGEPSVGIDQVKRLSAEMALKPFRAKNKVAVINRAQDMTPAAQNALLKTLEEPPGNSAIILTAAEESALAPTIVSRCRQVRLGTKPAVELTKEELRTESGLTQELLAANPGQRLNLVVGWTGGREEASLFCQRQLVFWRQLLLGEGRKFARGLSRLQIAQVLVAISRSLDYLSANANPRLTVENLVLSYPKIKG